VGAAWLKLYHFIHTALQRAGIEAENNPTRRYRVTVLTSLPLRCRSTPISPVSSRGSVAWSQYRNAVASGLLSHATDLSIELVATAVHVYAYVPQQPI
jgi:hypothetical protein